VAFQELQRVLGITLKKKHESKGLGEHSVPALQKLAEHNHSSLIPRLMKCINLNKLDLHGYVIEARNTTADHTTMEVAAT
jgi:hypothetical protein